MAEIAPADGAMFDESAIGKAGHAEAAPMSVEPADLLFRQARTVWRWTDRSVSDDTVHALYDLVKLGPTSANCSPARFLFLRNLGSKLRLRPTLSGGNAQRAMAAPVVVIVAHDPAFYEQLPRLYPNGDARSWFAGNAALAEETAFRNGTLQGAYLIMAARLLGLDCGPMSGFDNALVDDAFLSAHGWRSNFLVCLGYADRGGEPPRSPRLEFDEACQLW